MALGSFHWLCAMRIYPSTAPRGSAKNGSIPIDGDVWKRQLWES